MAQVLYLGYGALEKDYLVGVLVKQYRFTDAA